MSAASLWPIPKDLASRAAGLSFVSNCALMVLKLTVGIMTGSVAVLSDGVDSAQDVFASAVAFVSVRFAMRPADLSHPYGHGRAETLAAIFQAALIAGGAVFVVVRGIMRLLDPPSDIGVDLGLAAMLVTALVNAGVVQYVGHVAKVTGSPAIGSDARHLWTNVVQAVAIFAGLVLVRVTGVLALDPIVALLLAAYLFWTAGHIFWGSLHDILDASLDEDEVRYIEGVILNHRNEIAGYHRLRTRRSGQHPYIDVHVIQPGTMTVGNAAAIAERIEAAILERWPGAVVTIQTEPADGRFLGPMESSDSRGLEGERPASRL